VLKVWLVRDVCEEDFTSDLKVSFVARSRVMVRHELGQKWSFDHTWIQRKTGYNGVASWRNRPQRGYTLYESGKLGSSENTIRVRNVKATPAPALRGPTIL